MAKIYYHQLLWAITAAWVLTRAYFSIKAGKIHLRREFQLLFVYICIAVVARFTFFPFDKMDGKIQPLIFDKALAFPFRINLTPFVNLLNYPEARQIKLNIIGNTAMFIPLGIVWPAVYHQLDTHSKVICAGVGFSLIIELLQLPFYDRVSDVDDLLLNSFGFLIGYGAYLLGKKLRGRL